MSFVTFAFKLAFTQMCFRRELRISTENRNAVLHAINKCSHKYEFNKNKAMPPNSMQMGLQPEAPRKREGALGPGML